MLHRFSTVVIVASTSLLSHTVAARQVGNVDLTDYVLPLTGSINGGNTFPGVALPMGMVKLGPDLYTGSDSYSGYQPTGAFVGFSMLHMSCTGGAPKYGVIAQMPVVGSLDNPLANISVGRRTEDGTVVGDTARVGYYKASLASGVTVEMAASSRAGMYRYTFPQNATEAAIVVDVSHVLPSFRGQGLGQNYLGGNISVQADGEGRAVGYTGNGSYDNGWNRSPKWTVYFCGYFDKAATYKTFLGNDTAGDTLESYDDTPQRDSENRLGAVFDFGGEQEVASRAGVSFISAEQACENVNNEVPEDATIESLGEAAKEAWNSKVLSKITTTDMRSESNLQLLYSSLFHMTLVPSDKTGENPKWSSPEPYYDDIFTFWDIFRCTTALIHIVLPDEYEQFIRSLADIWEHDGFLPDGRSSFFNGATQGGSNADNVLADAYVKGVRGAIDWEKVYEAMVTDAEVVPPNNNDPRDSSSSTKEGRGALPDWLEHGYITTKYGRSVSRAIEYAGNDFGLYQVAKGLGKTEDAAKYLNRSRNWRNQWNPDLEALGFKGFLGPIAENGSFIAQDPLSCGGCYWGDDYYQGLPIEYSFNAHHDAATLIEYAGGQEAFQSRLEAMFEPDLNPGGDSRFNKTLFNPGNEPSFNTPYMFHYVGRPDLSVEHSRRIAKAYFRPTPDGVPGNSDAGAMESWVLWNMLGLYPVTGQTTFLVGSPWFNDLRITLGGSAGVSNVLHITTSYYDDGGDGDSTTAASTDEEEDMIYVQSLKVNGQEWNKSWVTWDDIFAARANGGGGESTMDFVLAATPGAWATGEDSELPPSPASEPTS
ncbi:glycoside hydrolase family 92 protein [Microdochium trichocladiopsis]|uniref:Glycoside hydrolase family 92 protein n=1 Tax=Microdochium trichocladiopsis TaxID=1682393 RepID=A0A9P8Y4N6_9PEZI|nr:glycoside hydrolase family 92 protein [Microdochium trichocladiopsis]KAH7031117.1 glycoside hydrolase family 92 protein [Microdochium trichocladiopsis]